MDNLAKGATRERVDFSRIKTSIPIPNLIEVQKKSYERFLQMDLLPGEREDTGLQSVFNSVFPISDFRGLSQLEFVDYSIGNWECKCGNLKGLHHLRSTCRNPSCGATIKTDPFHPGDVLCHQCGTFNKNIVTFCNKCGDPVGLQLKYDGVEAASLCLPQVHRPRGVFVGRGPGQGFFLGKILPYRGSWVEFEYDIKN